MSGAVPDLACRKRLRRSDNPKEAQSDDDDDDVEERKKMLKSNNKVKNRKTPAAFSEKVKKKERLNNANSEKMMKNSKVFATLSKEREKENLKKINSEKKMMADEQEKEENKMWNGNNKVKSRKVCTAFFDKEKEKLCNANSERKMRSDGYENRKRMHNCDNNVINRNEPAALFEKKKKEKLKKTHREKKIHIDDKEEEMIRDGHSKVKSRTVSTAFFEKEKKRKRLHNTNIEKLRSDDSEEKVKMCNCNSKGKNGKVSATFFEKEKKKRRLDNTNSKKKIQSDDEEKKMWNVDNKMKSRKVSTPFFEKEKKKKMLSSDNVEKKTNDKMWNTPLSFCKNKMQNNSRKKTAPITYAVKEKNMRASQSTEIKMQHNGKHKKRNVSSDISKEVKMEMSSDPNYTRKRKEPHTMFKKENRVQDDDNYNKIHNGKVKEKICGVGKEMKRKAPFTFFKVICNNFEEFLFIPPAVSPKLERLTNHHVYLEDSEGKCSKVRLSVVDGSLAFHQGWNIFVSDHLIKWGEFLLFEYTAKSTFCVRVFGIDSRERLHFSVESKRKGVRKKQTWSKRSPDDLVSLDGNSEDIDDDHYLSVEYHRSKEPERHHADVSTKEDPKRVECRVGSGPAAALDNKDVNLGKRLCKTKGISPLPRKEKMVLVITDSGPSIHENEDTVKLTTSDADSGTHHVTVNANEDPKRVQSGVKNGPSVVLGDENGNLTNGEWEAKCISPTCSKGKTRSEIVVITDAAPFSNENGDRVKLTTYSQHKEDRSMIIESEQETATARCTKLELHDSDEDLRRKQEISSIHLESTTAMDKYHNNRKMNISGNVCRKYEAPGGFRCLEKWKKATAGGQAALDGTGLRKPENPQKIDSKLIGDYGAIGLNPVNKCFWSIGTHACVQQIFTTAVKKPSSPDRVSKCGQGAAIQFQTKKVQMEPVGSIANHQRGIPASENTVVASNNGAIGLNPFGPEGTCAFIESILTLPAVSSPERISKWGSNRTEVNHNVNGNGTTVQLEIKRDQLEPMGGIVSSNNISVCADHVVAHQSEHSFSKQDDTKTTDCVIPVSLMPMKAEILESNDRSLLKINMQFCIPNTTRKWLELPKSLSNAVRQKKLDRNVIMLKDPMKRLWPVLYYEGSIFVGFTAGWKHFVAANILQPGDLCELLKEPDDEEPVYSVRITRKWQ